VTPRVASGRVVSQVLQGRFMSAGGVTRCQAGGMAAWATGAGQALIAPELYLPREWADDVERRRAAHVHADAPSGRSRV
jgi:SRSO17 transposase